MHPERVGRYELIRHLATGGMARVYLARATGLGGFARHVVIKAVAPERGQQYIEMFLDEARLAAMLHHQHIAQVFEVGRADDGTYFLAMEYVHGVNVRSLLEVARDRRMKLPLDVGVAVTCAAAAGLHHAHECCALDGTPLGIVHRDVSPSNVILGFDGSIKLIDFGIAKANERSSHTKTGFIKGKTGYMAPEQARGYQVDRRSDVFALGVLAYELTTQKRAFHGTSQFETMHKTIRGEVAPPSMVMPGYPPELEDVVMTALEVDPDDRFQDAEAMRQALDHVARELDLVVAAAPVIRALDELFPVRREPWLPGAEVIVDEDGTPPLSDPQIIITPARLARGTEPPVEEGPVARGSGPFDDSVPVELSTGPLDLANQALEVMTGSVELVTAPYERLEPNPAETARLRPAPRDEDLIATERPAPRDEDLIATARPAPRDAAPVGTARRVSTSMPLPPPPESQDTPLPDDFPIADDAALAAAHLADGADLADDAHYADEAPVAHGSLIAPDARAPEYIPDSAPAFRSIATRRPPRSMRAIAIGGAVLAGGFVAAMVISRETTADAPQPQPQPQVPAPAVAAAPAPTPPPPAPAPTTVQLHVTSEPTGATVVLDGVRLGTTPYTARVPIKKGEAVLKVRMQGRAAVKEKVSLEHDVEWNVALRPLTKF